ncbi:MAG: hypothetical protein M1132_08545 [Chloroflexi bacterium]|nr:hypothetical protein [Chloroflexota bacterium]
MDDITRDEFLDKLSPDIRPLIACAMDCECGCEVLDFFRQRPLVWLEVSDIVYHLKQPHGQVVNALNQLTDARILEGFTVLGAWTFYGLTRDAEVLVALEQFWRLRDDWHVRWERVRGTLRWRAVSKEVNDEHPGR